MNKITTFIASLLFAVLLSTTPAMGQESTSTSSITTTSETTNPETQPAKDITGIALGGVAVAVLIGITIYMVRNRRKNIGGMQNQTVQQSTPVSGETTNNPGPSI